MVVPTFLNFRWFSSLLGKATSVKQIVEKLGDLQVSSDNLWLYHIAEKLLVSQLCSGRVSTRLYAEVGYSMVVDLEQTT
jgi:hypothetical protein